MPEQKKDRILPSSAEAKQKQCAWATSSLLKRTKKAPKLWQQKTEIENACDATRMFSVMPPRGCLRAKRMPRMRTLAPCQDRSQQRICLKRSHPTERPPSSNNGFVAHAQAARVFRIAANSIGALQEAGTVQVIAVALPSADGNANEAVVASTDVARGRGWRV